MGQIINGVSNKFNNRNINYVSNKLNEHAYIAHNPYIHNTKVCDNTAIIYITNDNKLRAFHNRKFEYVYPNINGGLAPKNTTTASFSGGFAPKNDADASFCGVIEIITYLDMYICGVINDGTVFAFIKMLICIYSTHKNSSIINHTTNIRVQISNYFNNTTK